LLPEFATRFWPVSQSETPKIGLLSSKIENVELKVKGLYQKRGWFYFSRMRQGIRTVVALETQDMEEAIVKARKLQEQPMLWPEEARLEVKASSNTN